MSDAKVPIGQRLAAECALMGDSYALPVVFDLASTLSVVALLQLALRHPATKGSPTSVIARGFIAQVIATLEAGGFTAHAELVKLGDNPQLDQVVATNGYTGI